MVCEFQCFDVGWICECGYGEVVGVVQCVWCFVEVVVLQFDFVLYGQVFDVLCVVVQCVDVWLLVVVLGVVVGR